MVSYEINPIDLHGHLFSVTVTISNPDPNGQELWLPNWIPGSYLVRDFAKHVIGIYAEQNSQPIKISPIAKNRWQLAPCSGTVSIHYQVYAYDLSVRSAYLDQQQGFFNNTSLCLAVAGQTDEPCELTVLAPQQAPHWHLATGMPRVDGDVHGFGRFSAENYDALIDYPFLLGELSIKEFIAHGIKHRLVLSGRHTADLSHITADLARICEHQLQLFGDPAPFTSYTFLTMVVGSGFGGLEHRNSTALLCSRKSLQHHLAGNNSNKLPSDYRTFLSLCCHEYFHSWNVKTLKPRAFLPYQLDQESYTEQLWFYEGMTSYFDDYLLHQAGITSAEEYLETLGDTIARVYRGSGLFQQSITESSFLTWTKFYQQDENAPNAIVSYYAKGALIALCLDLQLRLQSDHQLTLAEVMRELWHTYGKTGKGTADDTVLEFLHKYDGINVREFLQQALYEKGKLPLAELLQNFGVTLRWHPAADDNGYNGKLASPAAPVALGAKYKAHANGLEITHVFHDEAAHHAGLSANDRIVAINYLQANDKTIKELLNAAKPGTQATIHAFRRDELLELTLTWDKPAATCAVLSVQKPEQLQQWLNWQA
ncbi:aminopeptidase [Idiomarina tyrosinivorans]|uniref:Aminopeptidase n=1 Tax=Idiomarina tyrosinivorans TaxID=1445662 RepID=A0A432ZTL4_9GAMM|nr:aminopeptidase [Idiomarina tyrosinivorans]